MKKYFAGSLFIAVCITCMGVMLYHRYFNGKQKTGFIRTGVVLNQYKAMTEATEQFNKEMVVVQANADTLKNRFEKLKNMQQSISEKEKADWGYRLGKAENDLNHYMEIAPQQLEARKKELSGTVLNKVNEFISDYGKQNGFAMILGTTSEGSVLYGDQALDLTDEILKRLNEVYESKKGMPADK